MQMQLDCALKAGALRLKPSLHTARFTKHAFTTFTNAHVKVWPLCAITLTFPVADDVIEL